ncbi:MAG: nuclear transport factor 2 family protein [Holophagales bacterium]|nr:nuclear transport factor 2 family protein [Holophagales bacterium]
MPDSIMPGSDALAGERTQPPGERVDRTAGETALALVTAIHRHDFGALEELLAPEHVLVDAVGAEVRGAPAALEAWRTYLGWFPDYEMKIERRFESEGRVALFGVASGTYAGATSPARGRWAIPAAWLAEARGGRVSRWQVFADNQPVRAILERAAAEGVS